MWVGGGWIGGCEGALASACARAHVRGIRACQCLLLCGRAQLSTVGHLRHFDEVLPADCMFGLAHLRFQKFVPLVEALLALDSEGILAAAAAQSSDYCESTDLQLLVCQFTCLPLLYPPSMVFISHISASPGPSQVLSDEVISCLHRNACQSRMAGAYFKDFTSGIWSAISSSYSECKISSFSSVTQINRGCHSE